MVEIDGDEFEAMVVRAVDALPERYRDQIANVAFAVEDQAQPGDYALRALPAGTTLLGVYRGIP
ncbi:MAG TPA: hypothetical protein VNM91_07525, partial [Dehalococcoidia bacterium]|nr:hypothetical protein [Dehalococcoidia bacterium]